MTLIQSLSSYPNPRLPFVSYRIPRLQTLIRHRRPSHLRIRSSFDELFKTLISSNPLDLIPSALTLTSTVAAAAAAALYVSRYRVSGQKLEPVIAEWILFTSPTPFNRCVLLRCPSISFEEESEKLLREERHYVNLSRGRILERKDDGILEEIGYQRVCVALEDGGVISLDWPENLDLGKEYGLDTTVLIVPGTGEGSLDRDVRRFVVEVLRSGCFPVVVNPRGCGGSPLTTARLFTAADSGDICTAIKYVNRLRPWTTLMGVGLGYGANMLTKYLAEVGESTPLTAAVCIDNPFDLEEVTRSLPHHMAMDQKLIGGLVEILLANKELFQGKTKGFDIAKALSATSVRDFDKAVSMISHGFDNVENFYSETSTRQLVPKLKVPVLFVQSDDGTVPLFSVPRNAIAENPFTSLLLCSCHRPVIGRAENSAIIWCQQLAIEWLSAVELALLKGRHPLLKDVDIPINPSKGLSFINGESSKENIAVQTRPRGIYDSSKWMLNNNDMLKLTSSNKVNGFLIDQFSNEKEGVVTHDNVNSPLKSESELGKMHKGDIGMEEARNADASENSSSNSSLSTEGDGPTDTEGSQVLQTATVVMNMLDVTMPGTLDGEQKKKVLTAMEQGETLVKALEGAVPDEVRGKLTTAVTEIMQTQGTNLNFDALKKIGWIHNVTSAKSKNQEKSKGTSTPEWGQDDTRPSDHGKNDSVRDGRTQETTECTPESTEASQEKAAQSTANAEIGIEAGSRQSQTDKLEEASGIDENNSQQYKVKQDTGKSYKHSADERGLDNGNDVHSSEAKKMDSPTEQNLATLSTNSDDASSAVSSDSEHQVVENVNDIQKNENKSAQNVADQNVQISTKPDQNVLSSDKPDQNVQSSSSNPSSISVTQALDALTGFDDSTQMAVNSVFEVIEDMIDQFEKASNEENDDAVKSNENHEQVNSKQTEQSNNKSAVEFHVLKQSNHPGNGLKDDDAKSCKEVKDSLKEVTYDLAAPVNNSISRGKESNTVFDLNMVNNANNFQLDRNSPYAAYLHRYFSQLPTVKSVDLDSTTDLFLDPEEGQWRMIDRPGYTKNTSENGKNNNINGWNQFVEKNGSQNIIEPSYVILDNELSRFEHTSSEKHEAVDEKHNDCKADFTCLIKNALLEALKVEVGRRLGKPDLEDLESGIVYDLEQFADTVSQAVVHDNQLNLDTISECGDDELVKFGKIEAHHIIKTISSAMLGASHLKKVLPLGVIVGSSLASLRTYFQVVSLHDDDQSEVIHESRHMEKNSHGQESETKKGSPADAKNEHVNSGKPIYGDHEVLQTNDVNNGGIMVGAVTAAFGASALLAHHEQKQIHESDENMGVPSVSFSEKSSHDQDVEAMQEKNQSDLVSSLAEKAMSVAGPVVPTKSGGKVDQERLVAMLAELGQKGGILRLVGKVALLWGGIRGAMSLTDRLISFLHIAERPLSHRFLGFVCMVLVVWSPFVIPLLPTIVQSWTTKTSNGIVDYACIIGLYVAITILVMLWGKRIRGYENPLQQYGLELTSTSSIHDFCKGLVGGTTIVWCIHSINALLGYAQLLWPVLPSSSQGALALIKAYGSMLLLAARGAMTAIGIAVVEELLFRSWLAEEVAADLGYYRAILVSGLVFSLCQRSLSSIPGLFLLSLALFGMKQRTRGSLSAPIGMRAGIMIANFTLQTGGFLIYWSKTPFWLASTHPWHPFDGVVGLCSSAILAMFFFPRPPEEKEMSKDTDINHQLAEKDSLSADGS